MQHAVAEQREAASAHRPSAHAEEFVVEFGRDREPQCAVDFGRNRLLDVRRQPERRKHGLRRLAHPAQAVERFLDKARRDHAPSRFQSLPSLAMAKLAEIMKQFCHRLQ